MSERSYFPFCEIVKQNDIKEALLLNLINPKIGGVLIDGYGGSATVDYAGCGGGGWYGGNASGGGEVSSQNHGGGGSGYIGGLTNGEFKTGVRSGHGYAVISWHPNI